MRTNRLKKELKTLDLFCIAAGTMISSGIFILPGMAFAQAGPAVVLAYFFSGILALIGALSLAELVSAMPKAGGDYFFTSRSLGPSFGTIAGFLSWISLSLKTAFAIFGIAEVAHLFWGWDVHLTAIGCTLFFLALNVVGVKASARFEAIIVLFLLTIMSVYVMIGLPRVAVMRFANFTPHGFRSVLGATGFVFVAYGGLLKVATIAEEVHKPKTTIPKGIFAALFVTVSLYTFMMIVTTGTLNAKVLAESLTPIADSAATFLNRPGYILMTFASLLAFISTGNSGFMAASRYPFALSRDHLAPQLFSNINQRFHTPTYALLVTAVIIAASFFLRLDILVKSASAFLILTYLTTNLSVIILRESQIRNYKPYFKSPFYPYIQVIGAILYLLLLVNLGWKVLLVSLTFIAIGLGFYLFYGRMRNRSEYALLHLIERITDRKLVGNHLENELKEILSERDEIVFDRFDHLVDQAVILDIAEKQQQNDFFRLAAATIAERLNLVPTNIEQALRARESESTTALNRFVAVPHLIIEGQKIFDLFIFRCRDGVYFTPEAPAVKAIFILIGTTDERLFHLRALSAIAQIVFQPEFEKHWLKARGPNGIKHLIHLTERQRFH